jgi:RimJ/RimL family protein N-acetyltransferase
MSSVSTVKSIKTASKKVKATSISAKFFKTKKAFKKSAAYKKYNHGLWAVILKEGNIFLGDCGITMQNIEGEVVPEMGFHIIKDYCGKGYATEAALACKKYAFEELNYSRLFSYTILENIPSQKVANKVGMSLYKYFEKNNLRQIAQVVNKDN